MLDGCVFVKWGRQSFFLRLLCNLGAFGARAAAGSRIIAFLWGDPSPGWYKGSLLCRLVESGCRFLVALFQELRQLVAAAAPESRAYVLLTGKATNTAGFLFSLLLGLGLTLLVGSAVRGGAVGAGTGLVLAGSTGLAAWLWPRRREIWDHSLTARIWAQLTALDD